MTDEQAAALERLDAEDGYIGEDQDYNVLAYSDSLDRTILVDEEGDVWYVPRWAPYDPEEGLYV